MHYGRVYCEAVNKGNERYKLFSPQVVDLTAIYGPNYVVISAKARRDFLLAVQQVVDLKLSNPVERRFVTELAVTLQQMWGEISFVFPISS